MRSGWWRSVGCSANTFFLESFIDELAAVKGARPLAYRRALLAQDAKWGQPIIWQAMRAAASPYTTDFYLIATDRARADDGSIVQVPENERIYLWLFGKTFVLSAVITIVCLLLAWKLVRSITVPLDEAVETIDAIAAGDLTRELQSTRKDEFGHMLRSLSAMSTRLRGVVSEVRVGVDSVSSASIQIANGNHDLSARTEQTASNLEETAASMEQLTATVSQSADTARQANQLAGTAAQAAARGGEVVGQVVSSMQQITDSSKKISDIIGTIDGIAFQTNILALNAAVEAARAGEQGRGFAVVAAEVRNLAQRTLGAAKEIKVLIDESADKVTHGSQLVHSAGQTMANVVGSVEQVNGLIAEITGATHEQSMGLAQINQAVGQLDSVTQQNSAMVEELSAAASSLQAQARVMNDAVKIFRLEHRK